MNMSDYQKHAVSTLALAKQDSNALPHRVFGLVGEAGQIAHVAKKIIRDKHGVTSNDDIAEITKRLGDVLYYVAGVADYYDLDLEAIARQNTAQSAEFKKNRSKT